MVHFPAAGQSSLHAHVVDSSKGGLLSRNGSVIAQGSALAVAKLRQSCLTSDGNSSSSGSSSPGFEDACWSNKVTSRQGVLQGFSPQAFAEDCQVPAQIGTEENIQVIARFRPMNEAEITSNGNRQVVEFGPDGRTCALAVEQPKTEIEFTFSRVFEPMASQQDIFDVVSPTILSVLDGINTSIIAYGQTGSGKTHTMMGPMGARSLIDGQFDDPELGIIPRALLELQHHVQRADGAIELRVSYIEIYQEKVLDLLNCIKDRGHRCDEINQHEDNGIYLPDVVQMPVRNAQEALEIMQQGNKYRTKAATQMNRDSSRSHAIFIVSVTNSTDVVNRKFAQLCLVDLAGSERVDRTGVWGKQLDEAKLINKSLLALGQVIVSLSEKSKHIPYRDSKLTRILQNALGGNARTCMICAVSPHADNANESMSTLRFGSRASKIRNEARMNIVLDANELKRQLEAAQAEIAELKKENGLLRQMQDCRRPSQPAPSFEALNRPPITKTAALNLDQIAPKQSTLQHGPHGISEKDLTNSGVDATCEADAPERLGGIITQRLFTRQLLPYLLCPITNSVMRDPVSAADGFTYERTAIERLIRQAGRMPAMSPMTGRVLPSKQILTNIMLRNIISSQLPHLPPLEAKISTFAKVSMVLLEYIFTFCKSKPLCQAQMVCKDFLAVGSQPRLWSQLIEVEFGASAPSDEETPKQHYISQFLKHTQLKQKLVPTASRGLKLYTS